MTIATSRTLTWMILLAALLAGLAAVAILPPWEGADETAHWSYLQQLSDTGKAPVAGHGVLSADLDAYPGPHPYGDGAPFEQTGFSTYRSLHRSGLNTLASRPTRFAEGSVPNWEAQHPPLYYLVLTPLYRAMHGLDFRQHRFSLRLASWLLAFGGLAVGALATSYVAPDWAKTAAPLMAAWPFMAPQVFPTLARLGNDSLCLLECGVLWLLLLRLTERPDRWVSLLGVGVILGLGLLTKAFFIPISVGVAGYLVFVAWREERLVKGLARAAILLVVAAVIGAWWYVGQYGVTHDLTGGADFQALKHQGGLEAGLDRNYSAAALARGVAAMVATFAWTGTWSLARPPEIFILGPILLVAIPLGAWLMELRKAPTLAWAPLFLVTPMLAGLCYHIVAFVALTGRGASTPGYYLHILAAPLAFAVALGWRRNLLLPALFVYTGLFTMAVWALEASMFGGCAAKLGDDPHFSFYRADCFMNLRQLQLLAHPLWAAGLAAAAILVLAVALARQAHGWRTTLAPAEAELIAL
ncbi:MAG: glycosyltransferase family 39 protein [Caulobacteraceae bacterium]